MVEQPYTASMLLSPRSVVTACLWLFAFAVPVASAADSPMQEWKDQKGAVFKGEPIEVMGPLALWRTGSTSSKFLPMRVLPPEDCLRFYRAIAGQQPRAARWSEAKGRASSEFIGRLERVQAGQFKPVDLTAMPEPELMVVVLASRRAEDVGTLLYNLTPFVSRMERVYPGRVAAVLMSIGSEGGPLNIRGQSGNWPWYVVDPAKQGGMKVMSNFMNGGGFLMMLMTRQGVPLFGMPAVSVTEVMQFIDGASDMLWQLNPANPRTARDRAHYLRTTRPVEFAEGKAGPLLLADMFKAEGLRQNGIMRIEAKIEVAADGSVTAVEMLPTAEMPPKVIPPLTEAIKRSAMFVPAIEKGVPVAESFTYSFGVGAYDKQLVADAAWVNGEARVDLPIPSWLVLKAVKVSEQVFGRIAGTGADGTVMMEAVRAGDTSKVSAKVQRDSFNNDWFSETGPASVRPKAGDKQEMLDGTMLTWKKMTPEDGLVDLLGNSNIGSYDYCIGYAWAEVEVPDDRDAWLGIGSDDGLKVWVNGEMVNDKWIERRSRLDDDVVPLRLKKGRNSILIKIQNAKGRWSFTTRLRVKAN